MNNEALIVLICIFLEIAFRLIPTKKNISFIDTLKQVMMQIHSLIDIMIPNVKKES